MQFILQKKRTILIIAGAIILISLVIFFLISFWQKSHIKQVADNFENYLLNDFDTAELDESGRGSSYDFHLYYLIKGNIRYIKQERGFIDDFYQSIDLEEYEKRAKEAESIFLVRCGETPKECHPLWDTMSYCMVQWSNRVAQNINTLEFRDQITAVPAFIETLEYWRDYLDEKEWRKEDLGAVLGVVMSEYLCGNMQNIDVAKWSEKTIGVEIGEAGLGEQMRYSSEKIQIINHLHGRINRIDLIPPYEGLEKLCVLPSEEEVLKGNVCDVHYYHRNKRFCLERGWTKYDQIEKFLKEPHSDPKKLICQISLLNVFRDRLPTISPQ